MSAVGPSGSTGGSVSTSTGQPQSRTFCPCSFVHSHSHVACDNCAECVGNACSVCKPGAVPVSLGSPSCVCPADKPVDVGIECVGLCPHLFIAQLCLGWGDWSDCSMPCGGGVQTRECNFNIPDLCVGVTSQACNTRPCNCQATEQIVGGDLDIQLPEVNEAFFLQVLKSISVSSEYVTEKRAILSVGIDVTIQVPISPSLQVAFSCSDDCNSPGSATVTLPIPINSFPLKLHVSGSILVLCTAETAGGTFLDPFGEWWPSLLSL